MKKLRRFLAMVLSLVMLIPCFPVVAEEGNGLEINAEEGIEVELIDPAGELTAEEPVNEESATEAPTEEEPVMTKVALRYFCNGKEIASRSYNQVKVGSSFAINAKEIEGYKLVQVRRGKESIFIFQGSAWNSFRVFKVDGDIIVDFIYKMIEVEPVEEEPAPEEPAPEEPVPEEPAPEEPADEEPVPEEPAPEEPADEEPVPEEPVPEEPAPEEPAPEEPADEEPVPEEPVPEEPAPEEPVPEEPAPEELVPEEPADEEPADEEPAPEELVPEEPVPEEPVPEEPAPEEPAPEEPAPEEPVPEEPAPVEPAPEEPAPEEPAPEEPAPEEPAPEEPAPEEPAPEEPAPEEPVPEEPAPEEPVPEEPADEEPVPEEPADEEPVPEEPAPEEPVPEEPADEEPADEEPADEEPADEEPADEEPAPEEPVPEEPIMVKVTLLYYFDDKEMPSWSNIWVEVGSPFTFKPDTIKGYQLVQVKRGQEIIPISKNSSLNESITFTVDSETILDFIYHRIETDNIEEETAEETPIEETPVEETPIEETPIEETPVEETPVEETPVEETPVEETPIEETPIEETPTEETPVEETPVEETPIEETPVEETPVEEEPALEEPGYPKQGEKGGVFSFGPKLMMLRGPAPTTYPVILDGELYGNYAVGATVTLSVTLKEHSKFTGWEAATTDGKVLITVNQFIMPASRVDVASQWEDEVHTVGIHFTANLTTGNQVAVSPSKYAEIKYGEPFDVGSFTLPTKKGYIPTLISCSDGRSLTNVTETNAVTFMNLDAVTEDVEYEVIYTPGDADYTVNHYLQELDGTYSDTPSKSEDFSAKLGNAIKYNTHVTGFEGFTWDGKDNILTVEAEDNVISLYYTRNSYSLNVQNGASGTTVRPYLFGQTIKLSDLGNPTLAGYTFGGWTIVNGDAIEDDFTMPSHTLSIEPIWTPAETSYTVQFWMETAVSADNWTSANSTMAGTGDKTGNVYADDSTAYEVAGTVSGTGTTGDIITKDMINALDVPASITDVGFIFNTMDEDVEIAADGSTIINVYFVRRVYYFHFTGTINVVNRYNSNGTSAGTGYNGVSTSGNFVTSNTNSNGYIYYKYGSPIAGKYWVYLDTYSDPANQARYLKRNNGTVYQSDYYGDRYTWAVREPEFRQDITEETAPLKGTYGYNETIRVTVRDVSVIISQWVIKEMPDGTYSDPECVRSRIGSNWYNISILRDNVLPDGYYFVGVSADGMKTWQSIPTDYEEVEYTYGYDDDYKQYYKVNRYRYNLTFVNFGSVAKNISQIMWGAELPEDALDGVAIEPITGYEDFEFAGFTCNGMTYTGDTPEEAYESFLASNSVMTQGDIVLTANWKAPIYKVNFYTTEDATTVYAADSVEKYQLMEAPINPTRVGYTFNGWYYYDTNHNVILYDPDKMPVTCDIDAYAAWISDDITADVIVRHFFGESEEDDAIPNLTLGAVYTAEAKVRDGWFPDKTSQSIMVVDGKNEIIFHYTYKDEVEYTVRFVDQDGNLLDIADNPHTDTTDKLSIVLRYRYVPFANPRTTSQTLRLTSGENIATFVYDIEGTREYTINHYTENVDGTFALYSSSSDEARYYLTVTAEELDLDGYEFDEDNSQTSLTILPNGKMEMNLYYKLPEYEVEYKYTSDSELTSVALPETKEYKRTEEVEIEDPLEAEDEWFEFDGWYFDEDCTESAEDFEISEDTTLYGKFVRVDYYVEVYWTPVNGEYYSGVREWDCNKLRWLIDGTDAEWKSYPSVECKVINHGKKSVNLNFTGNDQWDKYMVDNAQMPSEDKVLAGNDAEYTFQWNGEDASWDVAKLQAELTTIDVSNLFKLKITK